ncbi:MAG: hypothetical protein RLZ51_2388 [Pseudomonadota bacterium]|jgi:sugar phosphate isomerase/epimerase
MPTTTQNIEGLVPVEEVAIRFYLRLAELKAILHTAGVEITTISISGKKIALVHRQSAYDALARHIIQGDGSAPSAPPPSLIEERLDEQAEALAALKVQLEVLVAAQGAKR